MLGDIFRCLKLYSHMGGRKHDFSRKSLAVKITSGSSGGWSGANVFHLWASVISKITAEEMWSGLREWASSHQLLSGESRPRPEDFDCDDINIGHGPTLEVQSHSSHHPRPSHYSTQSRRILESRLVR